MHDRSSFRSRSLVSCLVVASACVAADYPDDLDGLTGSAITQDAGPTGLGPSGAALPDAGITTGAGATMGASQSVPGTSVPPGGGNDAGLTPGVDSGNGGLVGRPDAGGMPSRDASVTPGIGTSSSDAGSEPDAQQMPGSSVTSCTIMASTDADDAPRYRGKYGCAVWIGNSSKKVVKAFLVATRIAPHSGLSTYRTASSGVTVDVVAQATLSTAKQHNYTWDLKDGSGAPVPAGQYTLNVETHSESGAVVVSVPFDTSTGPVSATGTPKGDVSSASISCK